MTRMILPTCDVSEDAVGMMMQKDINDLLEKQL